MLLRAYCRTENIGRRKRKERDSCVHWRMILVSVATLMCLYCSWRRMSPFPAPQNCMCYIELRCMHARMGGNGSIIMREWGVTDQVSVSLPWIFVFNIIFLWINATDQVSVSLLWIIPFKIAFYEWMGPTRCLYRYRECTLSRWISDGVPSNKLRS